VDYLGWNAVSGHRLSLVGSLFTAAAT
jgi:hypothetical protein